MYGVITASTCGRLDAGGNPKCHLPVSCPEDDMWSNNDTDEFKCVLERADELAAGGKAAPLHLFLALLETPFGQAFLTTLGVERADLAAHAEHLDEDCEDYEDCLTTARRLTSLTNPGHDCVEQVLHGLLIDRECEFARALGRARVDRVGLADELVREMRAGRALSFYSLADVTKLASSEGRTFRDMTEGDLVRVCLQQPGLGRELLTASGAGLDSLLTQARHWHNPCLPTGRVEIGRASPGHLGVGLARQPAVQRLMSQVGVIPERLIIAAESLLEGYPDLSSSHVRESRTERAARQEAQRLGQAEVTPDLLLLGLLADPGSTACYALTKCGLQPHTLRQELTRTLGAGPGAKEPRLASTTQDVLACAGRLSDEAGPRPIHILSALLSHCRTLASSRPLLEPLVTSLVEGVMDPSKAVSCGQLQIGMTQDRVRELRAEKPVVSRCEAQDVVFWAFVGVDVTFSQGVVVHLFGDSIEQEGKTVLKLGDSPLRAQNQLGAIYTKVLPGPPEAYVRAMVFGKVGALYIASTEFCEDLE